MRYTKNMKTYEPLIIPLNKPFEDLTNKEAKDYFDWYMDHIDERSEYLRNKVSASLSISIDQLDYSLNSLIPVWKWFLGVAEIKNSFFLANKIQNRALKKLFYKEGESPFSVFTQYVLRDIAMYISKVFTHNYSKVTPTFKTSPKNYVYVNEPLLIGFIDDNPEYPKPFHPDLNPQSLVEICALSILDNTQHENDLLNDCLRWVNWIPKES